MDTVIKVRQFARISKLMMTIYGDLESQKQIYVFTENVVLSNPLCTKVADFNG